MRPLRACRTLWILLLPLLASAAPTPEQLEQAFSRPSLVVTDVRGIRFPDDPARRGVIQDPELGPIKVKLKAALPGADSFNNQPRYELAAYQVQKLFLDPEEYVVPTTVLAVMDIDEARRHFNDVEATIRGTRSVLVVVQAWLNGVTSPAQLSEDTSDPRYARALAQFNLLTYLIRHSDSNRGNFLLSTNPKSPRVYSVDNGVAFSAAASERGTYWRALHVEAVPADTMARLRALTREDLEAQLHTLAEFAIVDGRLEPRPTRGRTHRFRGVRVSKERVQFGINQREMNGLWSRKKRLIKKVDGGKLELLPAAERVADPAAPAAEAGVNR